MVYSSEQYIHELDRKAFMALNTFPKFIKLCETYSANYDEKAAKITFLSSAIRLSENQMPEVYNLLPPICEKLGIEVPELYYIKSKEMNAATGGCVNPYIFVTSELIEKAPLELVASVLAHECGHIACRHTLYHSIAMNIINGVENSPIGNNIIIRKLLSPSIARALLFWDRCSELSADRAAALCDGGSDKITDMLLKIHGFDDNVNREEFVKQAIDLRDFINDSKSNKAIEEMLISGESHPRLATRVYECYEWVNSEQYKDILAGKVTEEISGELDEEPIIEAEITSSAKSGDLGGDATELIESGYSIPFDLNEQLERVNRELDRYTDKTNTMDYIVGVASGILAGLVDAMFVGEISITNGDIVLSHQQVNNFIQEYAKSRGLGGDRLKDAISDLEQAFKVAQDNVWKGAGIRVSAKNHHLADLAHHPTPVGLMASIVVQFLRVGTFVNKDGEWHLLFVKTTAKDLVETLAPAILTGLLNWIVALAEKKYEEDTDERVPELVQKIAHLVASTPIIIEIAKVADNWFGHLVSDMGGSKNTAGGGMGIPGVFVSFLYEIASLPGLKDSGLLNYIDHMYEDGKLDLRHELTLYKELGKQAIPVIFNEIYCRALYFLINLEEEILIHGGLKGLDWSKIIPFANRSIDRVMMIASMTFTVADTADAAVHAAIESGGQWAIFAGSFVTRFNYVGAGRAALSVVKEISNEKKEAELIHRKLILTQIKTQEMIVRLEEYQKALEEKVATFIAEDIESFLSGFDYMNEGLKTGNSDLVIKGNVIIQKVLGREPQFTNQKEFDDLMDSDIALVL